MTKEFDLARAGHNSFTTEANDASLKFVSDVTPSMVRQVLTKNFTDIDTNKNNLLSERELKDFKPKPEESLVFDYSKLYFNELTRAHKENLSGNEQISKTDLVEYEMRLDSNYTAVRARYDKYVDLFDEKFDLIDTNKDSKVSQAELEAAGDNPQLDVGAKQMVRFFRDNFDAVATHSHESKRNSFDWKAFFPHNDDLQLDRFDVKQSKQWLDFNSIPSSANSLEYFGAGALFGSIGGAISMGVNLSLKTGRFPGWQAVAIGAAVGGLVLGTVWAVTGHQARQRVTNSRAQLWGAIRNEMSQETAEAVAPLMVTESPATTVQPIAPQIQSVVPYPKIERAPGSSTKSLLENL